ncbi:MAG: hypothetical protein JWP69_1181 [Flaviaesturariibacter sp.]|nr:hypothetical protein [Flaviaesturariibacter sp.]
MNDKQPQSEETKQWGEELRQDENTRQQPDPFKEVQQNTGGERSPEEEAEAEQQYKEALTERD